MSDDKVTDFPKIKRPTPDDYEIALESEIVFDKENERIVTAVYDIDTGEWCFHYSCGDDNTDEEFLEFMKDACGAAQDMCKR